MMRKPINLACIGTLFASTALAAQSFAQTSSGGQESRLLEEVIVTALKREGQTLLDAPAAINVIGSDVIDQLAATSLRDFVALAPGVAIDSATLGNGNNSISIRGVSSTLGASNIGYYIDDIPFSFTNINILPDVDPFDLDRVEVLKGPQGTLYGAGSSGGVVRIVTRDPILDEFEGQVEARLSSTEDGGQSYFVGGVINAPLIEDKLAVRASVTRTDNEGWIDDNVSGFNPIFGEISDFGSDYNGSENTTFRGKLLYAATDDLRIKLFANLSRAESTGGSQEDEAGEFPYAFESYNEVDMDQYGFNVSWDLPFATLTNDFGYIDYDNEVLPQGPFSITAFNTLESTSNELRLTSNGDGAVSWLAGVFYRDFEQTASQDLPGIGLPFNWFDTNDVEQWSFFGEATLTLMDGALDITVGVSEYQEDSEQTSDFPINSLGQTFVDLGVPPQAIAPPGTDAFLVETDRTSPSASIAFHPSESSTLYVRYAEGFRSGFNDFSISTFFAQSAILAGGGDPSFIDGAVNAEDIEAYEIGYKANFFDDSLYLELTVFRNDLSDTQQTTIVIDPASGVASNIIANVGEARTEGIEWLVQLNEPIEGLNMFFSGASLDAEIKGDDGEPFFSDGQRLNGTPELILNLGGSYGFDIGSNGLRGTVSGTVQYSDDRSLSQLGAAPLVGDTVTRVDARFELGNDSWSVYLYGQNLTDEDGRINPSPMSDPSQAFNLAGFLLPFEGNIGSRLRPRTLGAGVVIRF